MHYPLCRAELDLGLFPADYAAAREQWLAAVATVASPRPEPGVAPEPGLAPEPASRSFPCAGRGPAGEALASDAVWLGAPDAPAVLVVLGGTHGVEGFVGSAIQCDLLAAVARGQWQLPPRVALLLVHALTPWGYAWSRRCDAEGVDLNRNGIDFDQPLPDNPGYRQLRDTLFAAERAARQRAFADYSQNHGRVALEIAVSGGQYGDPAGPFYGGRAPAHGRKVCQALIDDYGLGARHLAVIDCHSGLGAYGCGELICDHPLASAQTASARRWYGQGLALPAAGSSSSVPKLGLLDYLWHRVMGPESCFVTLEFGTLPFGSASTDELFETLLVDHRLWADAPGQPHERAGQRAAHARRMRAHFCPDDAAWRQLVLFRGRQVVAQALEGVAG